MDIKVHQPICISSLGYFIGLDEVEITVTNTDLGEVVKRARVDFFNQSNNAFLASVFADNDGKLRVFGVDLSKHTLFAVSHWHNSDYSGAISDYIGGVHVDAKGARSAVKWCLDCTVS